MKTRSYSSVLPWKWTVSPVMTILHVAQRQMKYFTCLLLNFDFLSHNDDLMGPFFLKAVVSSYFIMGFHSKTVQFYRKNLKRKNGLGNKTGSNVSNQFHTHSWDSGVSEGRMRAWQPVVRHRQADVVVVAVCLGVVGPADRQDVIVWRRFLGEVVMADDSPVSGGSEQMQSATQLFN